MDDTLTLTEAQYEWALRLVNILTPLVYEGIHSIFEESTKLCKETNEEEKYLMTFQKFLSRVPVSHIFGNTFCDLSKFFEKVSDTCNIAT